MVDCEGGQEEPEGSVRMKLATESVPEQRVVISPHQRRSKHSLDSSFYFLIYECACCNSGIQ